MSIVPAITVAIMLSSCNNPSSNVNQNESSTEKNDTMEKKAYTKKYTNADFYKNGELQQDVVLAAYKDMFEFYGVPWSENLEKNFWGIDFGLGDMENTGMGGIFWHNDAEHGYFGHEIYLLPGQMIVEHWHVKTDFPAKHEAWKVNHGWCYNFGIGEATPNPPTLPESQNGHITVKNFAIQKVDEVLALKELESPHFLRAGDNGCIITEYGTYHDGNGLRFRNPKAKL